MEAIASDGLHNESNFPRKIHHEAFQDCCRHRRGSTADGRGGVASVALAADDANLISVVDAQCIPASQDQANPSLKAERKVNLSASESGTTKFNVVEPDTDYSISMTGEFDVKAPATITALVNGKEVQTVKVDTIKVCDPTYISDNAVRPTINEEQAAPRPISFPVVANADVTYTVKDAAGKTTTYNEGDTADAPTTAFEVAVKVTGPEDTYLEGEDNHEATHTFYFAPALTYITENDVRPQFNEAQAAPRAMVFPTVANAEVTWTVVNDADGATVGTYNEGDRIDAPEGAFHVNAKVNGPTYTFLEGEKSLDAVKTFYYAPALTYINAKPTFDEKSADRKITFPKFDNADVTWTVTDVNGDVRTYNEGDSDIAPVNAFKVTAKLSGPNYTFLEGTSSQDETVSWEYAGVSATGEKFTEANVWFDQTDEGNTFRVAPAEGVKYYFTEEDPANDNWTAVRSEWYGDDLQAGKCGVFTVKAVTDEGYTFGNHPVEKDRHEATWSYDFGPCSTEEPTTEPADTATTAPAAAAEAKPAATLAKTGASLTLGILASGLVAAGALLVRRRTI